MSVVEDVARTGRPVADATFTSKRARKAYRKTLRQVIANKIVDKGLDRREKQKYYQTLRLVKMRRRKVADELRVLSDMLGALARETARCHDRVRASNPAIVSYATETARQAASGLYATADEFAAFSRRTVLRYTTDGKVAK